MEEKVGGAVPDGLSTDSDVVKRCVWCDLVFDGSVLFPVDSVYEKGNFFGLGKRNRCRGDLCATVRRNSSSKQRFRG